MEPAHGERTPPVKRLLLALLIAIATSVGLATAASAEGQVCHSVQIQVNGEDVVNDASCTALPV